MGDESLSFTFSVVSSAEVAKAYAFHEGIAGSNEHIWPRSRAQLEAYAQENSLFGARRTDTGQFVGLCYVKRDSDTEPFELGGLTVAEASRKSGIAGMLVRFALAHVHESNDNPRHLLDQLLFEHQERKAYPGGGFPPSMKRDADGNVVGDVFRFTPKGLQALANWFTNEFRGTLSSGAKVEIQLGPVSLGEMLEDLRDMARSY